MIERIIPDGEAVGWSTSEWRPIVVPLKVRLDRAEPAMGAHPERFAN